MDEDFGKLVVRLTVGVLMLFHGVHKVLTGIDPIKHMVAAFISAKSWGPSV
jgi:putative oxidoreductase